MPSNFQRVAHVGFNSTAGFNLDNADPKILKFFEKVKLQGFKGKGKCLREDFFQARVKQKDLEDKNTRDAIFDFIENHPGGVDGALSDVERDTKCGQDGATSVHMTKHL